MSNQKPALRQSYEEVRSIVASLQQEMAGLRQAVGGNAEVLSAVISLLGESSVQAEMERLRQERQDAQEAQMAASIKVLLEAGVVKPLPETVVDALVVGTDTTPDGKSRRTQFRLNTQTVPEDILPKFLGKKPGDTVENNNVKMTIVEVYEVDKDRAKAFQEEQQKKALEAAQAAAEPAVPELDDLKQGVCDPAPASAAEEAIDDALADE